MPGQRGPVRAAGFGSGDGPGSGQGHGPGAAQNAAPAPAAWAASPSRRAWLAAWVPGGLLAGTTGRAGAARSDADADDDAVAPGRTLRFPRDHGAHPAAAIEWWYATGWLNGPDGAPAFGFQITFFRSRAPQADLPPALAAGRFAPRQLLFGHAAVTDLAARQHRHAQRITRWSGDDTLAEAHAARTDTRVALGAWTLRRRGAAGGAGSVYDSRITAPESGFTLALELATTQPLLLQGQAGFSQKGPLVQQASHYYSQPQLAVQAELVLDGRRRRLQGTGWLDHEWSHALLAPEAVGWDWIGINLADGGALTAFVLRRADGSVLWAGGSHRPAGGAVRPFAPAEVGFTPRRHWTSPATGARYPVAWSVRTPVGEFGLEALLDAQELDSRASTGAVYWEGLAALRDASGRRVGLGYLEMTGRAGALRLSG